MPRDRDDGFCCRGCRAVSMLLRGGGLTRYYDLRGDTGVPVTDLAQTNRDTKWLEALEVRTAEGDARFELDLQGVHCSACVWLVEELYAREATSGSIEVNPALGRCTLVTPRGFALRAFVERVEAFGYRFGPSSEDGTPASDALLVRVGVALALAGNTMMLSAAIHLGLTDGVVYDWANRVSFATAILATLVGAPVFARSAIAGLRRGILHLDLPIVLGMGLALVGSTWSFVRRGGANYVDTLTAFVALMLLGRWLQTRVLERNKKELLADRGTDSLLTRVVRDGRAVLEPCTRIVAGDELYIASGDLVPVRATLLDGASAFSFDWIDGESRPRTIEALGAVPAGAFLVDGTAARVRAEEDFATSEVASLLGRAPTDEANTRTVAGVPKNIGGVYVIGVLTAATITGVVALMRGFGVVSALEATTAALVVTCPCAFGIAVPLAYEVVQSSLRRRGIFVRRPSFFERALEVRKVVFDKTGTLTTGRLRLEDDAPLRALEAEDRAALRDLVARSNHPKSRAIDEALGAIDADSRLDPAARATETRGAGICLVRDGHTYRLGSAAFVSLAATSTADVFFARDADVLACLRTLEELRPETTFELDQLGRAGLDVYILSGDAEANVSRIAETVGVPASRAFAEVSPEGKAAWVLAHDPERILLLGDGINDALALGVAGCAGTPSIERPFTAARSDFYFVTPGLDAVAQTLRAARRLANVVRADLVIAVVYNAVAVALCIAGLMKPWLAALLMPASSLGTIAFTVVRLSRKERS